MGSTKLILHYFTALCLLLPELLMKSTLGIRHKKVSEDDWFRIKCPVLSSSMIRWLKDNKPLALEGQTHIHKKRIKLKFEGVKVSDSGSYSCDEENNGTWRRIETWNITVTKPETDCGKPSEDSKLISHCNGLKRFNNCASFPGKPREPKVKLLLHKGLPEINVQWKPPKSGFNDLWGYAISLLGYANHANHQECHQINSKQENITSFTFHKMLNSDNIGVRFGATYLISLTCLPPDEKENRFEKFVTIPEKCSFKESKLLAECYTVSNLTASGTQNSKDDSWVINVTWNHHQRHLNSLSEYYIYWTSYSSEPEFYNDTTVKANQTQISFELLPTTRCLNLTIIVFGLTTSGAETKKAKTELPFVGACPTPHPPVTIFVTGPENEKSMKIAVIVGSTAFSIMLVILLVVYRVYYKPVILKLPPAFPSNGNDSDPMLDPEKKRQVYIVHTSCCEKCKWAVTQFGDVLCKTGLIDVGLDLWDTLKMLPNKPLYYEKKIRESDCVVVVSDSDMKQCAASSKDGKPKDDQYVRFQLDLIRGELTSNPDTRKYIPVFMSFNSTKMDIPDFLSSRVTHSLPEEIDRIVFHLLNIERIQPGRRRMVAIIGGNDHPYDNAKKVFKAAIDDAARYHWESRTPSSDESIDMCIFN